MTDEQLLGRITFNRNVMAGKPVIKGTRLTVDYILSLNQIPGNTSFMPLMAENP